MNKPMAGHFAKAGVEPVRFLREVRVENGEEHKVGDVYKRQATREPVPSSSCIRTTAISTLWK